MKQINMLGYSITIERASRPLVGTLPTGKRARRKLAGEVDARAFAAILKRGWGNERMPRPNVKIQRIKAVRKARVGVGLYQAKAWVELAFGDNGTGEIV